MPVVDPTLDFERSLFDGGTLSVIGCDEVGRGALAGPVAVGMTVINAHVGAFPAGLRDSKLVAEPKREALAPLCIEWALYSAVGLASAREIDELGIIACLGLAGKRALQLLHVQGAAVSDAIVLLDGNHDYLNPALSRTLNVVTRVKADQDCASVAAASVIAKVHRDRLMIDHSVRLPGYGWEGNKGYGSAGHLSAIAELGATELHRRSWLKSPAVVQPA